MKYAYVGCRTTKERNARGQGISIYNIVSKKEWNLIDIHTELINPSFLIIDSEENFLYTVHGDINRISGFKINSDGTLKIINSIKINGLNPVHLTLTKNEQYLVVACLQTGNVISIERDNISGKLIRVVDELYISGLNEGDVSHPHQITFDYANSRMLIPCQGRKAGISKISVVNFDYETGKMTLGYERKTRELAEARHLCVYPNGKFVYLVNEKDNTICYYAYDDVTGVLIPMQILSTLSDTCTGDGWASGIALSLYNNIVYVSNRIDNSISWFKIDKTTGFLTYEDTVHTLGDQPRFICLDKDEEGLYIANENTDNIIRYEIGLNGELINPQEMIITGSPVSIVFK